MDDLTRAVEAALFASDAAYQEAMAQANAERLYPRDAGVRQMAETLRRDAAGGGSPP